MLDKRVFEVDNVKYVVLKPGLQILNEANKVRNKAFADAINSGAILRECLDDILRKQGLWNDTKEMEYQTLRREILDYELTIKKGGIKVSQGEQVAREIKKKRRVMSRLLASRTNLDSNTAEGQADNMRFNYLVSACTVYNENGQRYFKNLEDYLIRADDLISERAAYELYLLLFNQKDNPEKELPENKFLVRFGFMNDELKWMKDGKLVDENGRRIDEEGRYIDEEGNYVDADGNPVTKEGELNVEEQPFLDDTGNPIV